MEGIQGEVVEGSRDLARLTGTDEKACPANRQHLIVGCEDLAAINEEAEEGCRPGDPERRN